MASRPNPKSSYGDPNHVHAVTTTSDGSPFAGSSQPSGEQRVLMGVAGVV